MPIFYPQPDAKGIEETKRLHFEKTGTEITDDDARQMLERVMRYLWLLREVAEDSTASAEDSRDGDSDGVSDAHDAGK